MRPAPPAQEVEDFAVRLEGLIAKTPVFDWESPGLREILEDDTRVTLKLELLQFTGTFKVRGAFSWMMDFTAEQRQRGVTAFSAGNHAMAVGYAARTLGISAKVCLPKNANAYRLTQIRRLGTEVVLCDTIEEAGATAGRHVEEEGRVFVHPYEGPEVARGTGTVGVDICRQMPDIDALIVAIGGGGLMAGISSYMKQKAPHIKILGVEPEGAQSMSLSFEAGKPMPAGPVKTIADSLGPPRAEPYSYRLCRDNVDEIVRVNDKALKSAMALLYRETKFTVEPGGAAAVAALCGPYKGQLKGKKVGVLMCGSNIGAQDFANLIAAID